MITKSTKKSMLAHKSVQKIVSTKRSKGTENIKKKKLCEYDNKFRCYVRECACAV